MAVEKVDGRFTSETGPLKKKKKGLLGNYPTAVFYFKNFHVNLCLKSPVSDLIEYSVAFGSEIMAL